MDGVLSEVKRQAKVIFFDAAGTLIHLLRPVGWHYAGIARRHGWTGAREEDFDAGFRAAWKHQAPRPAQPGGRPDDDVPWWRDLAFSVLDSVEGEPAGFDREAWFDELYEHFAQPGVWGLYEDVEPCLARAGAVARLAVISNFDRRLPRILEGLGVRGAFEQIFLSSEVGSDKPDEAIFLRAAEAMGVEPGECLHIGDDPIRDWEGARRVGMASFALDRPWVGLGNLSL